ncbi:MAG: hypothetical protein J3K34DRAFT_191373 [Monoraphidium minutum]|nr:MAG: hypothetical protein J3K34DRAFT_191373 [Monoraphidium minutum]
MVGAGRMQRSGGARGARPPDHFFLPPLPFLASSGLAAGAAGAGAAAAGAFSAGAFLDLPMVAAAIGGGGWGGRGWSGGAVQSGWSSGRARSGSTPAAAPRSAPARPMRAQRAHDRRGGPRWAPFLGEGSGWRPGAPCPRRPGPPDGPPPL